MKKKALALFLAAAMTAAALAGCGGSASTSAPASGSESSAPAGNPADKFADGVLVIGSGSDLITLDPANQNQTNNQDLFMTIGSQLFTRDLDFNLVNDLCESYTEPDELTWEFKIIEGVTFTNGEELKADDVAYTLTRLKDGSDLVAYSYYKCITGVEEVDEYTIRLTTNIARPDMLTLLAMSQATILPKDYIEAEGMEAYMKAPVTSGAYQLKEWVPDDHYTLVPNDNFYGEKAAWKEVTYRPIPESSTRVSELLTGGVDVIYNVPVNEWERVENDATSLVYGETSRVMLLIMRMTDGSVCSDPAVRKAIEMAIDKKAICEQLLQGAGTPTRTRVGSSVPGFNEELFGDAANLYDPEGAKAVLAEAGYAEGEVTVDFQAPTGRYLMDTEMAQMIAAYLEAVGIHANLELLEGTVLSTAFTTNENKDVFLIGLSDGQYDGCYPLAHYGDKAKVEKQTGYDSPECQGLYQKALVELDPATKEAYEKEIQAIAAEDRPHICIAQLKAIFGADKGLVVSPRMDSNGMPDEIVIAK